MSFDLSVWTGQCPTLPDTLPESSKWEGEGWGWEYSTPDWHLCLAVEKALKEDAPEEIANLLPEVNYLIVLNFEGRPSDEAEEFTNKTGYSLARASGGILLNPQTGEMTMSDGKTLPLSEEESERFSILQFSWWFTESPLFTEAGLDRFISALENTLPEALPRRYGNGGLPQHTFAETGRDHFRDFVLHEITADFGWIVWYPSKPVVSVYVGVSAGWGPVPWGFRANHIWISLDAAVLKEPGWQSKLETFWKAASEAIVPFYGDVRTLGKKIRIGRRLFIDDKSQNHPVRAFWKGIPSTLGHAAVIGEPYLSLWRRFARVGERSEKLAFLSTRDWTSRKDATWLIGWVPLTLKQPFIPGYYCSIIWPFEKYRAVQLD